MEAVLQGNTQYTQYRSRHSMPEIRRGISRALIKRIIAVELVVAAAFSCVLVITCWNRMIQSRQEAVYTSVTEFNTQKFASMAGQSIKVAEESIWKEVDQTMWVKDGVYYRTGPGTEYKPAGTLDKYQGVNRIGITYNKWSQIVIDDEEYYVYNDYLTDEQPLVTATGAKGDYQRYALSLMSEFGWADSEILPLISLWNRESGWNPAAHNGSSGAHGIPQALPASKMAAYGSDYYTNGKTQIRWGLNYIAGRYGSPSRAWAHFRSHNWY